MATVPPKFRRATEAVRDFFTPQEQPRVLLTDEQAAVATWLRGQDKLAETLEHLLRARIEERGQLPVPSTPEILAIEAGRNKEAREIIAELRMLQHAPVPPAGSEE